MFDKLFRRNKLVTKTSDHIELCKDKRVLTMSERDFNSTVNYLHSKKIKAGDTITLTASDGTRVIFVIRKNKKKRWKMI